MSRDGFLERWSRRKLARGEPEPAAEPEPAPEAAGETSDEETLEQEILDEAELARLPSLDSFTVETDLAPFLRKGVPQAMRNAAMRKMWMLDPAIRDHVDFAVDYAWDWNTPGGVAGNAGTISHESVARMMDDLKPKRSEEPTAKETVASAPDDGPSEPQAAALPVQDPEDRSVPDMPRASPPDDPPDDDPPDDDPPDATRPRARAATAAPRRSEAGFPCHPPGVIPDGPQGPIRDVAGAGFRLAGRDDTGHETLFALEGFHGTVRAWGTGRQPRMALT